MEGDAADWDVGGITGTVGGVDWSGKLKGVKAFGWAMAKGVSKLSKMAMPTKLSLAQCEEFVQALTFLFDEALFLELFFETKDVLTASAGGDSEDSQTKGVAREGPQGLQPGDDAQLAASKMTFTVHTHTSSAAGTEPLHQNGNSPPIYGDLASLSVRILFFLHDVLIRMILADLNVMLERLTRAAQKAVLNIHE